MASKVFEVGDVLPQGKIRIFWDFTGITPRGDDIYELYSTNFNFYIGEFGNRTVTVTYNGIEVYHEVDIDVDEIILTLNEPNTITYADGTTYVDASNIQWEVLPSGYSVTFEENGGSTVTDLTEQTNLPSPLPTTTKANHVFAGWYYDNLFTQKANAGDELTANVTLYAKWYTPTTWCEDIADAIREKDGTTEPIKHLDFPERILAIPSGGGEMPSTAGGGIFTGATIPLTYRNNTHDYENNYEYKSATHNITITGLDGRATITGNGTKSVTIAFDVTSATSSLKNFTITCVNGEQTLEYKGLHAHYGTTVTGILTFAYTNITPDGSEGTIGTNYKFIITGDNNLPLFTTNTTLWNTIYSHQVMNVLMGNYSLSYISTNSLYYCYSFNQPLTLPSNLTSIGGNFLASCYSFNQPLTLPSNLTSIGLNFLSSCYSFNQPLTIPSDVTSIGGYFLDKCYSFNQPLTIPSDVTSIDGFFLGNCYSFNQPLTIPSGVTSIGGYFLSNCYSFNQPLTLPSNITSIGIRFLYYCYSFNQPLTLPSNLTSIGGNFLASCYSLSVIIYNASVYPTDNNSLSQDINSKTSASGAGIIVYGAKRAELMSALPNRTSTPFRKLIDGGS